MMKYAWDNYRAKAWGDNELKPITHTGHSGSVFGSARLGASIIDGIDTLHMMGLMNDYMDAREFIRTEFDMKKAVSTVYYSIVSFYNMNTISITITP